MALTQFTGPGFLYPRIPLLTTAPTQDSTLLMDAATDSAAMIGRVWTPNRGSKSIRKIGFLFGAVEKGAGTDVRVSLQSADLTAGPIGRPDGVVDQFITIADSDAGYNDNLWYQTGALDADRSVTYGELLSVVWDFNGTWVSPDSTIIRVPGGNTSISTIDSGHGSLYTGASWAFATPHMNVILEFSDGTFGTLMGAFPCSSLGSQAFNSGTAGADEFALQFSFPVEVKVDGCWVMMAIASNASDFNVLLTDAAGTAVSGFSTVSVDASTLATTAARHAWFAFSSEVTLAANTTYYLSIQPTTANNVTLYTFSVSAAGHLDCHEGGQAFCLAGRINGGAWAAPTLTSRPFIGLSVSSIHGAGGSNPLIGPGKLLR